MERTSGPGGDGGAARPGMLSLEQLQAAAAAVDVDMNTVGGYEMSSWERGYGDFVLRPDMSTLRRIPWHPGTVLVLADVTWLDGTPVVASPRQILQAHVARLAE